MKGPPRKARARQRDVAALLAFIESRHAIPHALGRKRNDCVAFVLGAVRAETGRNRDGGHNWSTLSGAMRVLKRFGSLEAAFDAHFQRIPPAHAMRGDIAGVPDTVFGIHPMIVEGELLVGPGEKGNRRMPRRAMAVAWSAVLPAPAKAPK